MKHKILELMVQSPTTQIPNHIKYTEVLLFIVFIIRNLFEALEVFFMKKRYNEFDPHVGETSCQIRAYQVLLMAMNVNSEDLSSAKNKLQLLRLLQGRLEKDISCYKKMESTRRDRSCKAVTLENFIHENEYNIEMTENEFFLIQARILTIYKRSSENGDPEINYEKMMNDLFVSKSLARRIIHLYQINLAKVSCQFIFGLLKNSDKEIGITQGDLEELIQQDDDKRSVIPCFLAMKIILDSMLKQGAIVFVLVKREWEGRVIDKLSMQFYLSNGCCDFVSTDIPVHNLSEHPCYVLEGVVKSEEIFKENKNKFKNKFLQVGLLKVILANMAVHPQYSGNKLRSLNNNPFGESEIQKNKNYKFLENEILSMKKEAKILGCGIDHPKLFYIIHIFCDTLGSQNKLCNHISPYFSRKEIKQVDFGVNNRVKSVKEPMLLVNT